MQTVIKLNTRGIERGVGRRKRAMWLLLAMAGTGCSAGVIVGVAELIQVMRWAI